LTNNYNHIAFIYDALVRLVFGHQLVKAQRCFLSELPQNANILFVGGGTGKILPELLSIAQPHIVDYVELSPKMISIAKKRCLHQERVQFIQKDFNDFVPNKKYDVVITFFFLDLFEEEKINRLIQKINMSLSTDGLWLFADFVDRGHYQWYQKVFVKLMYAFFRLFTNVERHKLPHFLNHFAKHSLHTIKVKHFFHGLISSKILVKEKRGA